MKFYDMGRNCAHHPRPFRLPFFFLLQLLKRWLSGL